MSVHDGHRERLRNRFLKEGLDNFEPVNVLELLLFYCVPRKNTNELAHKLLKHFGSFHQVLEASPEDLAQVPGVGASISTFLPMITAAFRYYRVSASKNGVTLDTIEKCGDYLVNRFVGMKNEVVMVLCLDAKCKLIVCRELGEGSVNSISVSARRVVETALGVNATSVVIAHNHPSGVAVPSADDVQTTRIIGRSLNSVGVVLTDHLVIADEDYVSLVQSGLYRYDALED